MRPASEKRAIINSEIATILLSMDGESATVIEQVGECEYDLLGSLGVYGNGDLYVELPMSKNSKVIGKIIEDKK